MIPESPIYYEKVRDTLKKLVTLLSVFIVLLLAACGDSEATNNESNDSNSEANGVVTEEDFNDMYHHPKDYKGYEVEFTGQVFFDPERDDSSVYLQVYANPSQLDQNVIVTFDDPDFDVKMDDYVEVKGIVKDEFKGENLFGETITAPLVEASSIEVVDYITAVAPTIKEVSVEETIDQHGMEVTLQKIEFAENETRVYMKVINNTKDTVYFDNYGTKLISGSSQYEVGDNFESGLPELPYDILAGVEAEGVLTFPAIEEHSGNFSLHAEGYSDDFELEFEPFVFEVEVE